MKIITFLELELEVSGDYSPFQEGVTSLNVLPENCYPDEPAYFEVISGEIIITGKDKKEKRIKCPADILDLLDEKELLEQANEQYNN